ncbi:MAG: hypothetical protein JSU70_11565 [Phycisphaerales bacterium]|nr:MAG: hypothetical protein JSU70_11565 [Phycisphaerales bacterium]
MKASAVVERSYENSGDPPDFPNFNGALDDIRLYDYALSGGEIVQLPCTDPPPGDANGDCEVDFLDPAILMSNWLRCDKPAQELCGQ